MRNASLVHPLFAAVLGTLACATHAQRPLFTKVEPFDGVRYDLGYDMAAQGPTMSGRSCVDFDSEKTYANSDGVNDSNQKSVSTSYELVKVMNLTTEAQLKAFTGNYSLGSDLEVAHRSEVHQFSEAKLFFNYRLKDTPLLIPEHIALKKEYLDLMKKGPEGRDEFRAKCGNGFVIGVQTGEYYYGTSYKESTSRREERRVDLNVTYSLKSSVNVDGYTNYKNAMEEKSKRDEVRVRHSTTNNMLLAPQTPEELQKQWAQFLPTGKGEKVVRVFIAPYTVAQGALPEGLLSQDPDQEKLDKLLEALWDLKTLKDAANFVLREPQNFALGLPTGQKRAARLAHVRSLYESWSAESERLLATTKACVKSFEPECATVAQEYAKNPRISQAAQLPKRYGSQCYTNVEVRFAPDSGKFRLDKGSGDSEMGGGPVKATARLSLWRASETLAKGKLFLELQEDKKDRSTWNYNQEYSVFDLRGPFEGQPNPLAECRLAPRWLANVEPLAQPDVYGAVQHRITKQDPRWEVIPGKGMLKEIACQVDTTSSNDRLECNPPQLDPLTVSLVNVLDLDAEKWTAPLKPGLGGALKGLGKIPVVTPVKP